MKQTIGPGFLAMIAAVAASIIWIGVYGQSFASTASASRLQYASIRNAVKRELAADHVVPAHLITVEVSNGIVTLDGRVDNILAKERATRIAEVIRGVREVINRIIVRSPFNRLDAKLKRDVRRALVENPVADAHEVNVHVENGTVFLSGAVDSWPEYRFCERAAKQVKGVVDVRNNIQVHYALKRLDDEIQIEILERLRWDVLVGHRLVRVSVSEGKVTLHGRVGSAVEKMRAVYDAYVAGVTSVDAADLEVARWAIDEDLQD